MKRLILDHIRRWKFALTACCLAVMGFGVFTSVVRSQAIEFWLLMITMWMGGTLLVFDTNRGFARALAVLPLTNRQIMRAWWLATVAIPAVIIVALLWGSAGLFCWWRPSHSFPAKQLSLYSLYAVLWLGSGFVPVTQSRRVLSNELFRHHVWTSFVGLASMLMMFGSMIASSIGISKNPAIFASFAALGLFLTILGWYRAHHSDLGCGNTRLAFPQMPRTKPDGHQALSGETTGSAVLLTTVFRRFLLHGLPAIAVMLFFMVFLQSDRLHMLRILLPVMLFTFGFLQITPVIQNLRFLRTLPMGPSRLAFNIIGLALFSPLALASLLCPAFGLMWGSDVALAIVRLSLFIMAPFAFWIFFLVWRGSTAQTYAFMILTATACVPILVFELPTITVGIIAVACFILSFCLIRWTLQSSSHPYRAIPNTSGNFMAQ